METVELNVLEVVVDALNCRTAYAMVEGDMKAAAKCIAVTVYLRKQAEEMGLFQGGEDGVTVKGATA